MPRRCDPSALLYEHRHGEPLVQDPQLSLGALLVDGVHENSAVEEGAVDVSDHGSRVAGSVGLLADLERFHAVLDGLVPLLGVALVAGVDLLACDERSDK